MLSSVSSSTQMLSPWPCLSLLENSTVRWQEYALSPQLGKQFGDVSSMVTSADRESTNNKFVEKRDQICGFQRQGVEGEATGGGRRAKGTKFPL